MSDTQQSMLRTDWLQRVWQTIHDSQATIVTDLIGLKPLRDAIIVEAIDPTVTLQGFILLANKPRDPRAARLTGLTLRHACRYGLEDPDVTLRVARQLEQSDKQDALTPAAYLHWACNDTTRARALADKALSVDPDDSLARILIQAINQGCSWGWDA